VYENAITKQLYFLPGSLIFLILQGINNKENQDKKLYNLPRLKTLIFGCDSFMIKKANNITYKTVFY
jgi:hypothetical protein